MQSADHVLVTAHYGFKTVEDLARIEFLPAKYTRGSVAAVVL